MLLLLITFRFFCIFLVTCSSCGQLQALIRLLLTLHHSSSLRRLGSFPGPSPRFPSANLRLASPPAGMLRVRRSSFEAPGVHAVFLFTDLMVWLFCACETRCFAVTITVLFTWLTVVFLLYVHKKQQLVSSTSLWRTLC